MVQNKHTAARNSRHGCTEKIQTISQIFKTELQRSQSYQSTCLKIDETVVAMSPFQDHLSELVQLKYGLVKVKMTNVVETPQIKSGSMNYFLFWILFYRGTLFKTPS